MFGLSYLKLAGIGAGLLALIGAFLFIKDVFDDRAELRAWQNDVLTVTREAADNPKLTNDGVVLQIKNMGQALDEYRGALKNQNDRIDELGQKSREALARADEEGRLRKEVILVSRKLAEQLEGDALSPVRREELEAELRRVQDQAYKAGM